MLQRKFPASSVHQCRPAATTDMSERGQTTQVHIFTTLLTTRWVSDTPQPQRSGWCKHHATWSWKSYMYFSHRNVQRPSARERKCEVCKKSFNKVLLRPFIEHSLSHCVLLKVWFRWFRCAVFGDIDINMFNDQQTFMEKEKAFQEFYKNKNKTLFRLKVWVELSLV